MERQILISGFGGQGVLLMGRLLAMSGMTEGKQVTWMPAYGPEMRGGSANCSVVISDEAVGSPQVTEPDDAIIMNLPSLIKFENTVAPGGLLLYNTSLIKTAPAREDIRVYGVPCNEIAQELGNDRVANMVMMGAYVKLTGLITPDSLIESLRQKLGAAKEHLVAVNRLAIQAGAAAVGD